MDKKDFILVTGAGGFIGSNLTRELVRRGLGVRVLLKDGESDINIRDLIKNKKIEVEVGNLNDIKSLKRACKDIDIVFHLAAKADLDFDIYEPYYKTNVLGTKNLVKCCDKKLKRFIFYSSILAVGLPNTNKALGELYIGKPKHSYGKSKREAEIFLLEEYKFHHLPVVIIRPTTVYGPGETAVQYFLFKFIKENKFFLIGNGNNLMSYVYVKNLIQATILAASAKSALGQIYFINDERPYKYKEVVDAIYSKLGKKRIDVCIPFLLAYICAALFRSLSVLLNKKPIIYPSRVKTMVLKYAYSIKKAEKDLDYKPKYNLEMGISETYEWYLEKGLLK